MLRFIIIVLTVLVLTACNNSQDKTSSIKDRELVPEPDKDLREKYEAEQNLKTIGCIFLNPDTHYQK
jgi:hypothetical protein